MGTTRKTITVTDQREAWIKVQIEAGDFTNDSEYIRDLIRRDRTRQAELEAIRMELIKGKESGAARSIDADAFKDQMTAKHARRAS